MLQLINQLPSHVVGVRATGEVTKQDVDTVLIPAIDALADQENSIYYLLVLETAIGNWDLGAWVSDAKLGLKYLSKWTKIAVVTDQEGVQKFTDMFSNFAPGEAKGYPLAALEAAKAWLSVPAKKE